MWKPIVKVLPIHTNLKSLIIISRKLIMRLNEVVSQHSIHLIFKVSFHTVSNDFLIMLSIILVNCIYCKHNAITFLFFSHILHLDSISPPSVPTFSSPHLSLSSDPWPLHLLSEKIGLPETTTKHGIICYNKSRYIPSHQDWNWQLNRKKGVSYVGKRVSDHPATTVKLILLSLHYFFYWWLEY